MTQQTHTGTLGLTQLRCDVLAPSLWILAVLAWGLGDYLTTHAALAYIPAAYEATPLVAAIIDDAGFLGHAAFKALTLALAAIYYQRLPIVAAPRLDATEANIRSLCLAIPLALAAAGTWLTLNNIDVLLGGPGL